MLECVPSRRGLAAGHLGSRESLFEAFLMPLKLWKVSGQIIDDDRSINSETHEWISLKKIYVEDDY
jgi:hypothetical protein